MLKVVPGGVIISSVLASEGVRSVWYCGLTVWPFVHRYYSYVWVNGKRLLLQRWVSDVRSASTSTLVVFVRIFQSVYRLACTFWPRYWMRRWYHWCHFDTVTNMSESCHVSSDTHAFLWHFLWVGLGITCLRAENHQSSWVWCHRGRRGNLWRRPR